MIKFQNISYTVLFTWQLSSVPQASLSRLTESFQKAYETFQNNY